MRAVTCLALLALVGACGGTQTPTDAEEELAQRIASDVYERLLRDGYLDCAPQQGEESAQTAAVQPMPATAEAPRAREAAPSNDHVSLAFGFMPDPHLLTGGAGGPKDGSDFGPHCVGFFSEEPNHIFEAETDFIQLRFLVNASNDTTLAIRTPDGRFLCDDDTEGFNPIIAGSISAGTHSIWVGTYDANTFPTYTLGIPELNLATAASLN